MLPKNLRFSVELSELKIDGFDCFTNILSKVTEVRGTVIYVNKRLKAQQIVLQNDDTVESVWCEIPLSNQSKLLVGTVYRSPNSTEENNTALNKLISNITTRRSQVLMMGDFNLPEINWDDLTAPGRGDNKANTFLNTIRDTFMFQHVKSPTHYRGDQDSTLIDLIFTSEEGSIKNLQHSSPLGKSHHHCLTFQLTIQTSKPTKEKQSKYAYLRGDYQKMGEYLNAQEITSKIMGLSTQEAWDYLALQITTASEKFIPKVNGGRNSRKKPLWLNDKALNKVKKKQAAYKRYMDTREGKDYLSYVTARNQAKSACRQAIKLHEKEIAKAAKSNPKAFYAYAKSKLQTQEGIADLTNPNGQYAKTDPEKAETLNNFFCKVFTKEKLQNMPELPARCETQMKDIEISTANVKKLLKELDTSKSAGADGMHPKVLRELSDVLAEPLAAIFRTSLNEGILPHQWKSANITPLFKKGNKSDPGNYRPVSLTSIPCKMMEKIIRESIFKHLEEHNLLTEHQHGFVTGKSCVTNLLGVMDDWTKALDNGTPIDAIYLDFSKAFDSVPHQRLIKKVEAYGIGGKTKDWLKDFLIGRKQRVRVNGALSSWKDVTSGVPQGSVLGPVLFVVFINDLPEMVSNKCSMYADDTKIYTAINDDKATESLQQDLDNLVTWADNWQLRFNAGKCKALHMGSKNQSKVYSMKQHEDGSRTNIDETDMEKDLGVLVDKDLKFVKHITSQVNKANKILGLIRRSYEHLNGSTMKQLFIALVRPHLEFAQAVWSPQHIQGQQLIEGVLHRATKCIPGLGEVTYEERLKKLKIPSMSYRRMRGDLIEVYKFMHNIYKDKNPFQMCNSSTTRGHNYKCSKQFSAANTRKHFFCNRVVNLWNSLDNAIVEAPSLNSFKNRLDKHFRDFIYSDRIDYGVCSTLRHRPMMPHNQSNQEEQKPNTERN